MAPATRARAARKAQEQPDTEMPSADEPLRKSARRVGTAVGARRIKITPLDSTAETDAPTMQLANPIPKKRTTRTKKLTDEEAAGVAEKADKQPARAKRQPASTKATEAKQEATVKARGRPKKAELPAEAKSAPAPARQTRTRAASGAVNAPNAPSLSAATTKAAAPKKKVTFQEPEDGDKENRPLSRASTKTKTAPTTGLKAKPVRRPATAASKTKAAPATRGTQKGKAEPPKRILTPKKVTQVAKSSSPDGLDEDELSGEKTPLRNLTQSPRRNMPGRVESPVKKLDFGVAVLPGSLSERPVMGLQSPARRQALSPFKDALKESPKRVDVVFKLPQTKPAATPLSNDQHVLSASTLGQSPKRGVMGPGLFPTSPFKATKSPLKASLLRSPPKRLFSPSKRRSPEKNGPSTPTKGQSDGILSPDVAVSSHFRASQSPQRSVRVHKMTMDEMQSDANPAIDFDQSIIDIRSPLKVDKQMAVFDEQDETEHDELMLGEAGTEPIVAHTPLEATQGKAASVDSVAVNPASLLFRAAPEADEDSSEDELQSPIRPFNMQTPSTAMAKRSFALTSTPNMMAKPGFTPLAAQLSGWLAASPDKAVKKQPRGLFSPAAAQHVPGEVIVDRRSPALSRISTDRLSIEGRQSLGQRLSLTPRQPPIGAALESPQEVSAFAEEMAIKELEKEMEATDQANHDTPMASSLDVEELLAVPEVEESIQLATNSMDDVFSPEAPSSSRRSTIFRDLTRDSAEDGDITVTLPEVQLDTQTEAEEIMIDAQEPEASVLAHVVTPVQDSTLLGSEITPAPSPAVVPASQAISFDTPIQQALKPRYAHTVSKVPLRGEGMVSPIKVPKKRSRSFSAGPPAAKRVSPTKASGLPESQSMPSIVAVEQDPGTPFSTVTTPGQQSFAVDDFGDSTLDGIEIDEDDENLPPMTPTANINVQSLATPSQTPIKTPAVSTPAQSAPSILQGAVIFLDAYTSEGEDASGIFVELLTQMGARCVKSWSWNPRTSMGGDMQSVSSSKIGITHVVYKDGGKRTLEKVRDTDGVVKCVGVGWVLE